MNHPKHDVDEEIVNELTTRILELTTGMNVCPHYFEEAAWRLVASAALEQAEGNPVLASDIMEAGAKRQVERLRDPRTEVVMTVNDGKRLQ